VFRSLPTLETDRVILRKMTFADAMDIFEYAANPEVSKYTNWNAHQSVKDTKFFLNTVNERYKNSQITDWGIVHKKDQKLIGTCGFVEWDMFHNRAEIGYALSHKYWRQGYMTEAVMAVMNFGFRKMDLNRIEARCQVENVASSGVMEKVGMKFEGILRQQMLIKGEYWDLKIYSILRQEFFDKIGLPSQKKW
jgi:ribosomal-protein-alanine N-acetyltransferase